MHRKRTPTNRRQRHPYSFRSRRCVGVPMLACFMQIHSPSMPRISTKLLNQGTSVQ